MYVHNLNVCTYLKTYHGATLIKNKHNVMSLRARDFRFSGGLEVELRSTPPIAVLYCVATLNCLLVLRMLSSFLSFMFVYLSACVYVCMCVCT